MYQCLGSTESSHFLLPQLSEVFSTLSRYSICRLFVVLASSTSLLCMKLVPGIAAGLTANIPPPSVLCAALNLFLLKSGLQFA